jgi:uroporphyrinogen-III synthase
VRELQARGAWVKSVIAYRTIEAPTESRSALREALDAGPIDAVVFTSGSTVRGLAALAGTASPEVIDMGAVCIGAPTAFAARNAGFRVLAVPEHPSDADVAEVTARLMRSQVTEAR